MNIVIAAGGTGGHIFPALSVAIELKKESGDLSLLWIGTSRNREKELCEKYNIPIKILDVSGINRKVSLSSLFAIKKFVRALSHMNAYFKEYRPDAAVAFGGYVCAPVLAAARKNKIPYFLQEQNSVPGLVNRFFSSKARSSFLGYPLSRKHRLKGKSEITGTPIRTVINTFENFKYPERFDKTRNAILICGGSQGAASMNDCLIEPIKKIVKNGIHVIWQTGSFSYEKIVNLFGDVKDVYIFDTLGDLYPYYAASNIVICRSGASTLNEIAYFGLPCITIPLPWAAENHQWMNAAYVEHAGWGIRVAQDENCGAKVEKALNNLLSNKELYENMSRKALDNSPVGSASVIAKKILEQLRK